TWLEPITVRLALNFLAELFWMPLAFVSFLGAWTVLRHRNGPARVCRDFAGLTALVALPFVLILVSIMAQPVYLPRYALPAVVGFAPLSAWAVSRLRSLGLGICILILILFSGRVVKAEALDKISWSRGMNWLIYVLRQQPGSEPIVFESPAQA